MNQDADAALAYLADTRHLPAHSMIIYGTGLGAPVAVSTAARHPETAALILENIGPDTLTLFAADTRTRILPVRLLTSDRFDPTETLKTLQTPQALPRPRQQPTDPRRIHRRQRTKNSFSRSHPKTR